MYDNPRNAFTLNPRANPSSGNDEGEGKQWANGEFVQWANGEIEEWANAATAVAVAIPTLNFSIAANSMYLGVV